MKVEIEIPDGKYCKDCKLYHCGNELGYLCGYTGNQLAHDDERISEFGFKYHFIKDNQCPITNGIPYSPDFTRNKILLEKPFGTDLENAADLVAHIDKYFRPEQVYRIDHYFFKEIVQGIENFRFSNNLFEGMWDKSNIERIYVRLHESIGVESRGSFYDGVGALRDVIPIGFGYFIVVHYNHVDRVRATDCFAPEYVHQADALKQAAAVGAPALLQFIKAGKLRCIATGSSTRLPLLPEVPTVAEQGYKGFEMTQWYGLLAPSKLPKGDLDKLEKEAVAAARSKTVHEKLSQDTALAIGNTRAEFEAFIKLEQARWKPVIARAQVKPEGV